MAGNTISLHLHKPYPKQKQFYESYQKRVAYGGARGGGKSVALREKLIQMALHYHGIQILLLRRTYPELRENHVVPMRKLLQPLIQAKLVKYTDAQKDFVFFTGSRIKLGYCKAESDVLQYQGQAYDVIGLDEATHFTEFQYSALTESNRLSGMCREPFNPRMYLTCNPGGVGHAWVKRLFIDRRYINDEDPADYAFIQAKVYDNDWLMQNDPEYVRALQNIPDPQRRKAFLEGDWDVFEGQYFTEFNRDIHVVKPFVFPPYWKRYISMDYGLDMLAAHEYVCDVTGRAWVINEIYKEGLIVSAAAEEIKRCFAVDQAEAFFAPPDLWNRHSDTGKSTAELFAERGVVLSQVSNDRIQGWYTIHEMLNPVINESGEKEPMLKIFENCVNLIRTLPMLQHSDKNPNDCATEPHEITHAPDSLRAFACGRPFSARTPEIKDYDEVDYSDEVGDFLNYRT